MNSNRSQPRITIGSVGCVINTGSVCVCEDDEEKGQFGGLNVVLEATVNKIAGAMRSPPVTSGESRRQLSSMPFRCSSGECRLEGSFRRSPVRAFVPMQQAGQTRADVGGQILSRL
jgi:hypothetical protein